VQIYSQMLLIHLATACASDSCLMPDNVRVINFLLVLIIIIIIIPRTVRPFNVFYSAQRLDLFTRYVRLSRLLVGFLNSF